MLTIFAIPKAFAGHIGVIQRNAVRSWARLRPECQIILCGDDAGTKEVAAEYGVDWIPEIKRNEFGTPLLNSAFEQAMATARFDRMCYVNADIMLLDDFTAAVGRVTCRKYLVVGQRWDVALKELFDFDGADAGGRLREYIARHGTLHPPSGSDYFVFPKGMSTEQFPPFAVGRPGWDNWFIYSVRRHGIPVIDATRVTTVIHQNHDYQHVPNRQGSAWEGPEADRNLELMGGQDRVFTLLDATRILTAWGLLPAIGWKYLQRRWQVLPVLIPSLRPVVQRINAWLVWFRSWCHHGSS